MRTKPTQRVMEDFYDCGTGFLQMTVCLLCGSGPIMGDCTCCMNVDCCGKGAYCSCNECCSEPWEQTFPYVNMLW